MKARQEFWSIDPGLVIEKLEVNTGARGRVISVHRKVFDAVPDGRRLHPGAMQALGSYRGGSMLFLGLGTGLGSALVVERVLEPMELAHLPYNNGKTFEEFVGTAAIRRLGD